MPKLMFNGHSYTGGGSATTLNELIDVNASNPTQYSSLYFDGTEWIASDIPIKNVRQVDITDDTTSAQYRLLLSGSNTSGTYIYSTKKTDLLTYNPNNGYLRNYASDTHSSRLMVADSSGKGMFLEQGTDGGKGLHFTDGSYVYTLLLADASNNVTIGNKLQSAIKALFSDLCKINTFTKRYSVNAGATVAFKNDFITVPSGYTMGAILGFSTNHGSACMVSLRPDVGGSYDVEIKNTGSGTITDGTFWVKILFIKSDFISFVS